MRFDPFRPFKKNNDQTAFELHCTSQNFYPETIRFKSYSPLKYFIQVSMKSSILFSIFIKSCIFSLFTPFWINFNQGQYGLTHILFLKKMINFRQKHIWFKLRCIFISFSIIFLLWNILDKCQSRKYGLTRILHFNQFLSKSDMAWFALYLQKFSVNIYQEAIPFERSCPFKDSQ